ncbi:MAG: ABC transporter permease [Candidatus Hodarchaeales archaeon]|jgi:peptide/nickel transport system ATP-binding protein/peptide/nickel transport system permease protein
MATPFYIRRIKSYRKSWSKFWTVYKTNRLGLISIPILGFLIFLAIFADQLTPFSPNEMNYNPEHPLGEAPSPEHPLGTNRRGNDILTALLYGLRVSLLVAFIAGIFTVLIGTMIGVTSAYIGGRIDIIIMRITEIILVIPALPVLLLLASTPEIGGGTTGWELTSFLFIVIFWPVSARLIRSQALSLKERTFVLSAKAAGAGNRYIIWKHIFPNVVALMVTMIITAMRQAILYEAFLAYLGFGDPLEWSLGSLLRNAQSDYAFTRGAWWHMFPPAIFIALIGLSFAFIGLTLDAIVNPRLRKR